MIHLGSQLVDCWAEDEDEFEDMWSWKCNDHSTVERTAMRSAGRLCPTLYNSTPPCSLDRRTSLSKGPPNPSGKTKVRFCPSGFNIPLTCVHMHACVGRMAAETSGVTARTNMKGKHIGAGFTARNKLARMQKSRDLRKKKHAEWLGSRRGTADSAPKAIVRNSIFSALTQFSRVIIIIREFSLSVPVWMSWQWRMHCLLPQIRTWAVHSVACRLSCFFLSLSLSLSLSLCLLVYMIQIFIIMHTLLRHHQYKQRFTLIPPNMRNILTYLDVAKAADVILLIVHAAEGVDSFGELVISALRAQGLTAIIGAAEVHLSLSLSPSHTHTHTDTHVHSLSISSILCRCISIFFVYFFKISTQTQHKEGISGCEHYKILLTKRIDFPKIRHVCPCLYVCLFSGP